MRIVNPSPLILLAGVDGLELLREPPDSDVTVPDAVFQELFAGERFDPNMRAIRLASATSIPVRSARSARLRPASSRRCRRLPMNRAVAKVSSRSIGSPVVAISPRSRHSRSRTSRIDCSSARNSACRVRAAHCSISVDMVEFLRPFHFALEDEEAGPLPARVVPADAGHVHLRFP